MENKAEVILRFQHGPTASVFMESPGAVSAPSKCEKSIRCGVPSGSFLQSRSRDFAPAGRVITVPIPWASGAGSARMDTPEA